MIPSGLVLKIASSEHSTMAAISRKVRSDVNSAWVFCRTKLPTSTASARNTASRSTSSLRLTARLKRGESTKKSRQAVDTAEQSSAGPSPKKRAVTTTAARNNEKGWRCRNGDRVQTLSATQAASTAQPYCTSVEWRCSAVHFSSMDLLPDMVEKNCRFTLSMTLRWSTKGGSHEPKYSETLAAAARCGNCKMLWQGCACPGRITVWGREQFLFFLQRLDVLVQIGD